MCFFMSDIHFNSYSSDLQRQSLIKKYSTQAFVSIKLVDFSETNKAKFKSILDLAESRLDIPWRIVNSLEANFYVLDSDSILTNDQNIFPEQCIYYTLSTINTKDANKNELIISGDNIPSVGALVQLFNRLITIEFDSNNSSAPKSIESQPVISNHDSEYSIDGLSIKSENIVDKSVPPPSSNSTAFEKNSELKKQSDSSFNNQSHLEIKA